MNYPDLESESLLNPSYQNSINKEPPQPFPQNGNQTYEYQQQQLPIRQITYNVSYGDTLEGIALQFGIAPYKIRVRNNLDSDEIYMRKSLIIPDPSEPVLKVQKEQEEEIRKKCMVNSFRNQMQMADKSDKTAIYYLMESNWEINKAILLYKQDLQFQKNNSEKEPKNQLLRNLKKKLSGSIELIQKKRQ